ncbi:MAG: OmpA family protein [Lawsonibacter sp.]|jgi:chemotaxis protein MotB|nr:OmpA family protein [Lawsonibacter sp.]
MASIKKKSSGGGGGANWMDTYGDMVTLLLCFFVLLYSISTIDAEKWMIVVRSFNRDAMVNEPENPPGPAPDNQDSTGGDGMPALSEVEEDLTELYKYLKNLAAAEGEGTITVTQGTGYVFISFADAVFFDGDSYILRQEGKTVLDKVIPILDKVSKSIDELKVIGHTAQAGNTPNPTLPDRLLSSQRSATVAAYVQDRISLAPGRIISEGDGQWRNKADNATLEGKAQNRRVEMIVTGRGLENELGSSYDKYNKILEEYNTKLESTGVTEVPD